MRTFHLLSLLRFGWRAERFDLLELTQTEDGKKSPERERERALRCLISWSTYQRGSVPGARLQARNPRELIVGKWLQADRPDDLITTSSSNGGPACLLALRNVDSG